MITIRLAPVVFVFILLLLAPAVTLGVEVGEPVPDFSLPSLQDPHRNIDSSQSDGKLLYVDFWSAWCEPCREKMPFLAQLTRDYVDLQVIGVNVDPTILEAYRYLVVSPVNYPVVIDRGLATADRFGIQSLPIGFLVDRKGIVRSISTSATEEEFQQLRFLIESLLVADSMTLTEDGR